MDDLGGEAVGGSLLLCRRDIAPFLDDRGAVVSIVEQTYRLHAAGRCRNDPSRFLRFPEKPGARVISMLAYVGALPPAAGLKEIASFPDNLDFGRDRASGLTLLNSTTTGAIHAVLEGVLISVHRTAASAALAARELHPRDHARPVGVIGCGPIGFETLNYLSFVFGNLEDVLVFDVREGRALAFARRWAQAAPDRARHVVVAAGMDDVLRACGIIVFATSATVPHVGQWRLIAEGTTVLHISLRDLPPDAILAMDNVVDDDDHIFDANTSVHLAEQSCGHRGFVRATLGEILLGRCPPRSKPRSITIFSPFGLGMLDISLANHVATRAIEEGRGIRMDWTCGPLMDWLGRERR